MGLSGTQEAVRELIKIVSPDRLRDWEALLNKMSAAGDETEKEFEAFIARTLDQVGEHFKSKPVPAWVLNTLLLFTDPKVTFNSLIPLKPTKAANQALTVIYLGLTFEEQVRLMAHLQALAAGHKAWEGFPRIQKEYGWPLIIAKRLGSDAYKGQSGENKVLYGAEGEFHSAAGLEEGEESSGELRVKSEEVGLEELSGRGVPGDAGAGSLDKSAGPPQRAPARTPRTRAKSPSQSPYTTFTMAGAQTPVAAGLEEERTLSAEEAAGWIKELVEDERVLEVIFEDQFSTTKAEVSELGMWEGVEGVVRGGFVVFKNTGATKFNVVFDSESGTVTISHVSDRTEPSVQPGLSGQIRFVAELKVGMTLRKKSSGERWRIAKMPIIKGPIKLESADVVTWPRDVEFVDLRKEYVIESPAGLEEREENSEELKVKREEGKGFSGRDDGVLTGIGQQPTLPTPTRTPVKPLKGPNPFHASPFSEAKTQANTTQPTMATTNQLFRLGGSLPKKSPATPPANRILAKSPRMPDSTIRLADPNTVLTNLSLPQPPGSVKAAAGLEEELAERVGRLERRLEVSLPEMKAIRDAFLMELEKSLRGESSSIAAIPSFVPKPTGREKGLFLGLDLGGTNVRILKVQLDPEGREKISVRKLEKFALTPVETQGNDPSVLFNPLARRIVPFLDPGSNTMGFTFSFPVNQTAIHSGQLQGGWTKGFDIRGMEGKDVAGLLLAALSDELRVDARNISSRFYGRSGGIDIAALVNDTVGTLAAACYKNGPSADIGIILGTGTNAAYWEFTDRIPKLTELRVPRRNEQWAVNMEWGNFDKFPSDFRTRFDVDVDKNYIPSRQFLEKMVSGLYLGKVTRRILRDLIDRNLLFKGKRSPAFDFDEEENHPERGFKAVYLSKIAGDRSSNLRSVQALLEKLGIKSSTFRDRVAVKRVVEAVASRSARIVAAVTAATLLRMDPQLRRGHIIGIDGSLYQEFPGYRRKMRRGLAEVLGKEKIKQIKFVLSKDGSGIGAAVIAAIATQQAAGLEEGVESSEELTVKSKKTGLEEGGREVAEAIVDRVREKVAAIGGEIEIVALVDEALLPSIDEDSLAPQLGEAVEQVVALVSINQSLFKFSERYVFPKVTFDYLSDETLNDYEDRGKFTIIRIKAGPPPAGEAADPNTIYVMRPEGNEADRISLDLLPVLLTEALGIWKREQDSPSEKYLLLRADDYFTEMKELTEEVIWDILRSKFV